MSQPLNPMTHGLNGLVVAYAVVLIPIILGLRHGRAPGDTLWRAPIWAIPITLVAGIVVSLVSSPLRTLGVDKEGGLQLVFGTLVSMGVGYISGRVIAARKRSPSRGGRHAVAGGPRLHLVRFQEEAEVCSGRTCSFGYPGGYSRRGGR